MKAAANLEIAHPHLSRIEPAPGRILIKAVNWLGDVVMSLPALRAVRRAYPAAHLAVLIRNELASFFDGADWIDEVIPYSITSYSVAKVFRGLDDRRKLIAEIRARHFGLAILMPNSFESALWIRAAGIPMRAGFARDARGAMLTHKATPPRDALEGHQVNYSRFLRRRRTSRGCAIG
jgi:heptosyltransferase-2